MTGNTLPFSVGHLHPCVGPPLIGIDALSGWVRKFACEAARRDGRVPKYCDLHIGIVDAVVFGRIWSYLVAFAVASISVLLVTFPSLPVLKNLSASSGATTLGLFVFCY